MLPVKGRKLLNFTLDISPSCITTYPRKGAITITCYLQIFKCSYDPRKGARTLSPSGCNVSVLYDPRKGAETHPSQSPKEPKRYDPHKGAKLLSQVAKPNNDKCDPRKGTKNSASKKMRSFSFANLNSLFSVGCPSMNGTIAAAVIFSLLRLLHSDKMCYNKANFKHLLQN